MTFSNATSNIIVQKGAIDNISGKGIDGTDNLLSIQNIVGSAGDDSISGTSSSAFRPFTFFGSTGNDTYNGGATSNALDYSTLSLFDKALNPDSTGITFNSNGSGGFVIDKGAGNVDGTDTVNGSFENFTGSAGKDTFNISTSGTFAGGDGVDTFNVTGGAVVGIFGDQINSGSEEYSNTLNLTLGGGIAIDGNSFSSSQILGSYSSIDNLVVAGSNNTYSEQFSKPDGFVRVQLGGSSDTGNAVKNVAFAETLTPGVLLTAGGAEVHGWQSLSNIGTLASKALGYTLTSLALLIFVLALLTVSQPALAQKSGETSTEQSNVITIPPDPTNGSPPIVVTAVPKNSDKQPQEQQTDVPTSAKSKDNVANGCRDLSKMPQQKIFYGMQKIFLFVGVTPTSYQIAEECHGREPGCLDQGTRLTPEQRAEASQKRMAAYKNYPSSLHRDHIAKAFAAILNDKLLPFVQPAAGCNKPEVQVLDDSSVWNHKYDNGTLLVLVKLSIIDTTQPRIGVLTFFYYRPGLSDQQILSNTGFADLTAIPLDLPDEKISEIVDQFAVKQGNSMVNLGFTY